MSSKVPHNRTIKYAIWSELGPLLDATQMGAVNDRRPGDVIGAVIREPISGLDIAQGRRVQQEDALPMRG